MLRRIMLTGLGAALALPQASWAAQGFPAFLAQLQARAREAGIPESIIRASTYGLVPNQDVLKLDHHQPEFTLTWAQYSSRVLSQTRIATGQGKYQQTQNLFAAITSRYGVSADVMLGIWGLETNFGANQGSFNVIDALTTLAWDRQSHYFGNEVIKAMTIVARGDAPVANLLGSYAGAMGQPQFMPSTYLTTAVSFAGNGAPDIWNSDADALASMANYLAKAGWQADQPSSEAVLAPTNINIAMTGRENVQTIAYWQRLGVQRLPGAFALPPDMPAALLLPDGAGGQAFLVYQNFTAIRRYNPSDYYALAVGSLGRMILA
ncbi:MAG: lytic murein transglycosylase [Rhodospirillales bacterium]|nr:lytic murein transglycosylase [Rhodospirillales bacterium]